MPDKFRERYGTNSAEATDAQRMQFNVGSVTEFIRKTRDIISKARKARYTALSQQLALRADVTGITPAKVKAYVWMYSGPKGIHMGEQGYPLVACFPHGKTD